MEKLCVFCRHFYLSMGYGDLSEVTPGMDAEISCGKRRWRMEDYFVERDFRNFILLANTCPEYEYIPIGEIE